jgi:L-alanine-DL-glutamate epimerase-like enolase superfamily enzyme
VSLIDRRKASPVGSLVILALMKSPNSNSSSPRVAFPEITTSDGLIGWGEPVVEGLMAAAVQELGQLHPGKKPGPDRRRSGKSCIGAASTGRSRIDERHGRY